MMPAVMLFLLLKQALLFVNLENAVEGSATYTRSTLLYPTGLELEVYYSLAMITSLVLLDVSIW